MERQLTVSEQSHFDVYWSAFLAAKRPDGQPFDERRRDARIKKALCTISVDKEPDDDAKRRDLPPMRTVDTEALLVLEAADAARLLEYVEKYPSWNPLFVDTVVDAHDALESAEKVRQDKVR